MPATDPITATGYAFEQALVWLRGGRKILRRGWDELGMFIYLVPEQAIEVGASEDTRPLLGIYGEGIAVQYAARIDMRYADGTHGVWTPTVEDLLAQDWKLLE